MPRALAFSIKTVPPVACRGAGGADIGRMSQMYTGRFGISVRSLQVRVCSASVVGMPHIRTSEIRRLK